jgi:HK97 family phage major capsid protein
MTNIATIAALVEEQGTAFDAFKSRYGARLDDVQAAIDDANAKLGALTVSGGNHAVGETKGANRARAALGNFARTGNPDAFRDMMPKAAMQVGVDEDGGYLVPDELSTTILSAQRDISPMRRLAKVVMTNASNYQQPFNLGGTKSGWVGETDSRPETDTSKLTLLEFPSGEIYANPAVTQRMLDDAPINVGNYVIDEIIKQFEDQEGVAFLSGDGVKKPKGLLTYPDRGDWRRNPPVRNSAVRQERVCIRTDLRRVHRRDVRAEGRLSPERSGLAHELEDYG